MFLYCVNTLEFVYEDTMLEFTIRNISILSIAIYAFYKLLNIELSSHKILQTTLSISLPLSIVSTIFFYEKQFFNWCFILVTFFFTIKLISKIHFTIAYTTVLFSFAFSFITYSLTGILSSLILSIFFYGNYNLPWIFIHIMTFIIHFLLIYSCFRIPRLQKGMSFLYHIPSRNIGSAISFFIIMFVIIPSEVQTIIETLTIKTILFTFFFCFLLIYWWNYHLTQMYRKYLKKNEITTLNNLIFEKDTEIQRLKEEHDRLAHLIHKDNKLLPAFSLAITDFLENKNNLSSAELETYGNDLKNQLELLYDERMKSVSEHPENLLPLPLTNISSVDAILSFMYKKASKENIPFQLVLTDDISSIISIIISEKDLTLLLSELLENALYESHNIPNAEIQVHLGTYNETLTIKVSNIGKRFEIATLQNLGIAKHTSHQNTGGSGTGMMDIWMLKENYRATLIIDETSTDYETSAHTCISILFNRKNHYIIHSDRYKDLIKSINRPDVFLLSKE